MHRTFFVFSWRNLYEASVVFRSKSPAPNLCNPIFSIKMPNRIVLINIQVTYHARRRLIFASHLQTEQKERLLHRYHGLASSYCRIYSTQWWYFRPRRQYGGLHKRQIINKTTYIALRPLRISRKIILWKNIFGIALCRNNTNYFLLKQIINNYWSSDLVSVMSHEFTKF